MADVPQCLSSFAALSNPKERHNVGYVHPPQERLEQASEQVATLQQQVQELSLAQVKISVGTAEFWRTREL